MQAASILLARVGAAVEQRSKAEAAIAERFAPRFNPVELTNLSETQLSSIFRWLLDESETHGQGPAFRDLFVSDLLRDAPSVWCGAHVTSEVTTADGLGRMDLLLHTRDGRRSVVIENKPWAAWQASQLLRYLKDQQSRGRSTRLVALVGHPDALHSLSEHWEAFSSDPLPDAITARSFDEVADWLDRCGSACRAERVRSFIDDLADYCRSSILGISAVTETIDTADAILAGGRDALAAAHAIAAALPLAQSRYVAEQLGVKLDVLGGTPTVQIEINGTPINFVLFGKIKPWAGVTEASRINGLAGQVNWARPEQRWPRWQYLKPMGSEGSLLDRAARDGNFDDIVHLLPIVARKMADSAAVES